MEPLSLASTIAGLAGAVATLVSKTYEYGSSVAGASKAQKKILEELKILRQTLHQLEETVASADKASPQYPASSAKVASAVTACQSDVDNLVAKLERKLQGGGLAGLAHRLAWPLAEKETLESVEALHRHRDVFQFALSVDTWNLASLTLSEVKTIRQHQEAIQRSQESQQILGWLSSHAGDYRGKHEDAVRKRVSTTGGWLLDLPEFQQFSQEIDSSRLLWCHGLPGAGKTVLSSTVIDHIFSSGQFAGSVMLYWYFDYLRAQYDGLDLVCATLLRQLLDHVDPIPAAVKQWHDKMKQQKPRSSDIIPIILSLLEGFGSVFLVFDALDECIDAHLSDILDLIEQFRMASVRIFATSRPHIDYFKDEGSLWVKVEVQAHAADVERMITHKLEKTTRRSVRSMITGPNAKPGLRQEIIDTILARANGMFLLASLQMEEVLRCTTVAAIRKALQHMPTTIYIKLDQTLDRIRSSDDDLALRAMTWLAQSAVPLSYPALSHALAVDVENTPAADIDRDSLPDAETVVEVCCGLVSADNDGNLRFVHFTVQEYLQGSPETLSPFDKPYIAKVCLSYLSMGVFRVGHADSRLKVRRRNFRYPLLPFAAFQWNRHAQDASESQKAEFEEMLLGIYSDGGLFSSYSQAFYNKDAKLDEPRYRTIDGIPLSITEEIEDPHILEGFTPLHNSVDLVLISITHRLLDMGADPSAKTTTGITPLHFAVRRRNAELVRLLLDAGADPSVPSTKRCHGLRIYGKWTPVALAAERSLLDVFGAFEGHTSEETIADALTKAAEFADDPAILSRILGNNPTIGHRHPAFMDALRMASRRSQRRRTGPLLHERPPTDGQLPPGSPSIWPLMKAIWDSRPGLDDQDGILTEILPTLVVFQPELAVSALEKGANPRHLPGDTWTALEAAATAKNLKMARLLVEKGADARHPRALLAAIKEGVPGLVDFLLDQGADISGRHRGSHPGKKYGMPTPLVVAVEWGRVEVVKQLLRRGANPNSEEGQLQSSPRHYPLQVAARLGNIEVAKLLLGSGADPNFGDTSDSLVEAALRRNEKLLELLLDHGANINQTTEKRPLSWVPCTSALQAAVRSGGPPRSMACIRLLLNRGADPNLPVPFEPPLNMAIGVWDSDAEVVRMLLEHGANPNSWDENGSALHRAAFMGRKDIIRLLWEHGADMKARYHMPHERDQSVRIACTIMYGAVQCRAKPGIVDFLLDLGVDISEPEFVTQPPAVSPYSGLGLLYEARFADYRRLVEHGARVGAGPGDRETPLQATLRRGSPSSLAELGAEEEWRDAVSVLIESGANVNAVGGKYGSAMQAACRIGSEWAVKRLLEAGASPTTLGGHYGTSLQAAAYAGSLEIVETLLRLDGVREKMNQSIGYWGTPLQAAAFIGQEDIVTLLLRSGADPNVRGGRCGSALRAAMVDIVYKAKEVDEILLQHGAVMDHGRSSWKNLHLHRWSFEKWSDDARIVGGEPEEDGSSGDESSEDESGDEGGDEEGRNEESKNEVGNDKGEEGGKEEGKN